jgi:uncharacterized membrane protein
MATEALRPTVTIDRHPIHPLVAPFAIACLVGTLLTDLAYWLTMNVMWVKFSTWLVSVGAILAVLTAIAGVIDIFSDRMVHTRASIWPYVVGNVIILILAILNTMVHTRDAWTAVVPWGLVLSALTVLAILVTGWLRWSMFYRERVGVAP